MKSKDKVGDRRVLMVDEDNPFSKTYGNGKSGHKYETLIPIQVGTEGDRCIRIKNGKPFEEGSIVCAVCIDVQSSKHYSLWEEIE